MSGRLFTCAQCRKKAMGADKWLKASVKTYFQDLTRVVGCGRMLFRPIVVKRTLTIKE